MTCHAILHHFAQTGAGACTWTAAGGFLSSTPHQVKTAQSITQLSEQKLDRAVEFLQQISFVLIQWQIPRYEKIRLSLEHGVLVTQSRKLQEISKRPCPLFLCSNAKNRRKNCLFHNLTAWTASTKASRIRVLEKVHEFETVCFAGCISVQWYCK